DRTARIWDAFSGEELLVLRGHIAPIFSVAYSPDARKLVTAGGDKTARVWDAGTGRQLLIFMNHTSQITSAAFSPDGQQVVSGSWDQTVRIWDAGTGAELLSVGGLGGVFSVAYSKNSRWVLVSGDKGAKILELPMGKELWQFQAGRG